MNEFQKWLIVGILGVLCYIVWTSEARAQEGLYLELGAGKIATSTDWQGTNTMTCMLTFGYQWERFRVSWDHFSQCSLGEPFNSRDEDHLDAAGVYYKIYF